MFKKKIFKKNVAVHCDTEAKDLALRTYAHSKGYKWCDGDSFLNTSYYMDKYDYISLCLGYCFTFKEIGKLKCKIIPFEKALKKGYEWNEELGKIVFHASEKEEKEEKEEVKYPIFAKNKYTGIVVKFTAIGTGEIILSNNKSILSIGNTLSHFVHNTNEDIWQILDYNEERGLYDTQPVLCWHDSDKSRIVIRFYNAIRDTTFNYDGTRYRYHYNNMKPLTQNQIIAFKDEIAEMYKNLKV